MDKLGLWDFRVFVNPGRCTGGHPIVSPYIKFQNTEDDKSLEKI